MIANRKTGAMIRHCIVLSCFHLFLNVKNRRNPENGGERRAGASLRSGLARGVFLMLVMLSEL
jgi:hypothetical protein